jgi:hypothetical protein
MMGRDSEGSGCGLSEAPFRDLLEEAIACVAAEIRTKTLSYRYPDCYVLSYLRNWDSSVGRLEAEPRNRCSLPARGKNMTQSVLVPTGMHAVRAQGKEQYKQSCVCIAGKSRNCLSLNLEPKYHRIWVRCSFHNASVVHVRLL